MRQATAEGAEAAADLVFDAPVSGRYLKIQVLENFGAKGGPELAGNWGVRWKGE